MPAQAGIQGGMTNFEIYHAALDTRLRGCDEQTQAKCVLDWSARAGHQDGCGALPYIDFGLELSTTAATAARRPCAALLEPRAEGVLA